MFRLTLILAIVIVVAMILLPGAETTSGDDATRTADAPDRPPRTTLTDEALVETPDGRLMLVTADGEELVIDLVVDPSALTEEDARVNLPPAETSGGLDPVLTDAAEGDPETAEGTGTAEIPETAEAPPEIQAAPGAILRVNGDRVNFRAGPSTEDAILAALTLGTEVELIERVGDGWAHLRVVGTDLSGYMSEDFLEAAN